MMTQRPRGGSYLDRTIDDYLDSPVDACIDNDDGIDNDERTGNDERIENDEWTDRASDRAVDGDYDSGQVRRAATLRIRREALRQLNTIDLDDLDSRIEPLPLLCRQLPY